MKRLKHIRYLMSIIPIFSVMFCIQGCEKDAELTYLKGRGTVTDIDGNVYQTVIIGHPFLDMGEQEWMAENLRVTRYRDGTPIPIANNEDEWQTSTGPDRFAWCNYDSLGAGLNYGALYSYPAFTNSAGLCPDGWRVPKKEDWEFLAIMIEEAGMLKSTRTHPDDHPRWDYPNKGATNMTGFSALPAGRIHEVRKQPEDIGAIGWWWTKYGEGGNSVSYGFRLTYDENSLRFSHHHIGSGFSVRCIKE